MALILAANLLFAALMMAAVCGFAYLFIAYLCSDVRWLRDRSDYQQQRADRALDEIVSRSTGMPIITAQPAHPPVIRDLQSDVMRQMEHDGLANAGRIDD